MRSIPVIAIALTLAACAATPKARIADALTGYGIARPQAECVGAYLQKNLSTGQLLELGRAARAYQEADPDPGRLRLSDLLRVTSQIKDPQVPITVARAAGQCGLVPAPFTSLIEGAVGAQS